MDREISNLDFFDTSKPVYLLDYVPSSQSIQGSSILMNSLTGEWEYQLEWIKLQQTIFSTIQQSWFCKHCTLNILFISCRWFLFRPIQFPSTAVGIFSSSSWTESKTGISSF